MSGLDESSLPVPLPADWAKIHELLAEECEAIDDSAIVPPPVPLILAGAAFSSASDIRQRWLELLDWADQHGFAELLLTKLPPPPAFDVAESIAGISEDGVVWWPQYGLQEHAPRPKPSKEQIEGAVHMLQRDWVSIAGADLARRTWPVRFTGRKSRRLIVSADPDYCPPWGAWFYTTRNPASFRQFRRNINRALAPMEVDHVVFRSSIWPQHHPSSSGPL